MFSASRASYFYPKWGNLAGQYNSMRLFYSYRAVVSFEVQFSFAGADFPRKPPFSNLSDYSYG